MEALRTAKPYSEFAKICQMVPIVLRVIAIVPGGGSGSTVSWRAAHMSNGKVHDDLLISVVCN